MNFWLILLLIWLLPVAILPPIAMWIIYRQRAKRDEPLPNSSQEGEDSSEGARA